MIEWVQFNVSDTCTLRCKDCHWFSEPVKVVETITGTDVLRFVEKWQPKIVQFSGGEPTLWKDLVSTVNVLKTRKVIISSNGTRPEIINQISRKVTLHLSIHRGVDIVAFRRTLDIAKEKQFTIKMATFDYPDNPLGVSVNQPNQMHIDDTDERIGCTATCAPSKIYFGSDGRAYVCEKGLRSKNEKFYAGFTVNDGVPVIESRKCTLDKSCLTASKEQMMEI
jgi:hypothetical protein